MTLAADRMIPLLPCRSIDDQITFYEAALGFEVTYRQKTPRADRRAGPRRRAASRARLIPLEVNRR